MAIIGLGLAGLVPALSTAKDSPSLDQTETAKTAPTEADSGQTHGVVEFGLGWVDDQSYRFGRYSGLAEQGLFAVLNMDMVCRAPWTSADPVYSRISLQNMGWSSRQGRIEYGRQGDYGLWLIYAQQPANRSDAARSSYTGVGGSALDLPSNWVGAGNTAGMSRLLPTLGRVRIDTERRRWGAGLDKLLSEKWDFTTTFNHERKQGLKPVAAVIGSNGGNPRAVFLPEPIDYETHQASATLRYTDRQQQWQLRYLVSLFNNANSALRWRNAYTDARGWEAEVGYPDGFGQLALPPDNQAHQLSLSGGLSWDSGLRLSGDIAFGRMTQDQRFLPYTVNSVPNESIVQALPRLSLDGQIDTTNFSFRLSARPTRRLHWNASLRYDNRDNDTPRNEYVYIGGDANLQNLAANGSARRFNQPADYSDLRLQLKAGYQLASRTALSAELEQRETERTYTERERAEETSYGIKLRYAPAGWFSGALRLERADRSGSTYRGNQPFLSGYAPGYTGSVPGGWDNPPSLRRFHLADRVRDRVGLNLLLMPQEFWTVGIDASQINDDYRRSELGLRRNDSDNLTVELSFAPSQRWSSYIYYTHEDMAADQRGVSIGSSTRVEDAVDPTRQWSIDHHDSIDSAGFGAKWRLPDHGLEFGADLVYTLSESDIAVTAGSALSAAPLPTVRTRLYSASLYGQYQIRDNLKLHARIWNERYDSDDYAIDGVAVNQLANVILFGEESADYQVTVLMFSWLYGF